MLRKDTVFCLTLNKTLVWSELVIQGRLAKNSIFLWPAIVTRLLTPRSRKPGYGLLLGCRSGLDRGPFEKTFFWQSSNPKTGKIFTLCFGPRSQSIGRGRISREGALDHRLCTGAGRPKVAHRRDVARQPCHPAGTRCLRLERWICWHQSSSRALHPSAWSVEWAGFLCSLSRCRWRRRLPAVPPSDSVGYCTH